MNELSQEIFVHLFKFKVIADVPYLQITERNNMILYQLSLFFFSIMTVCFISSYLTLLSPMVKDKILPYIVTFKVSAYSQELKYPTEVLEALELSLKETAQLCNLESMEMVCYHCSYTVPRESLMTSSKRPYLIAILFQVSS